MPTDRILTGRCDTTRVVRGRSSDSGSITAEDDLTPLPGWTPGAKAIDDLVRVGGQDCDGPWAAGPYWVTSLDQDEAN